MTPATLLADDGYVRLSADSSGEALDLLALHDVGVVVCDGSGSGHDSESFLAVVRDLHPAVLGIVVAGSGDANAIQRAVNTHQIHRYYVGPLKADVLRDDLRNAFRHLADQPPRPVRQSNSRARHLRCVTTDTGRHKEQIAK